MRPPVSPTEWIPFASRALEALSREYPSHVGLLLRGDADLKPPRELSPAFYGSFDWHSSVHGHWCLVRCLARGLSGEMAQMARNHLASHLTRDRLVREAIHIGAPEREGFERPYGLAWLLQLGAELREWKDPQGEEWLEALRPLESLAAERIARWLPRLRWPIRGGEHSQTAFALGLALDWARAAGRADFEQLIVSRSREFYEADVQAPIAYEPSGHDFLSPALAEADLMRRVLDRGAFARWLAAFLPDPGGPATRRWLTPVETTDREDGKLAHLDGLNLSRAWMLEGIAFGLGPDDDATRPLTAAAGRHATAGLEAARTTVHYAGIHWLSSFAVYLLSGRGIASAPGAA